MKKRSIIAMAISMMCLGMLTSCNGGGDNYDPDNFLLNGTEDNPYELGI